MLISCFIYKAIFFSQNLRIELLQNTISMQSAVGISYSVPMHNLTLEIAVKIKVFRAKCI